MEPVYTEQTLRKPKHKAFKNYNVLQTDAAKVRNKLHGWTSHQATIEGKPCCRMHYKSLYDDGRLIAMWGRTLCSAGNRDHVFETTLTRLIKPRRILRKRLRFAPKWRLYYDYYADDELYEEEYEDPDIFDPHAYNKKTYWNDLN